MSKIPINYERAGMTPPSKVKKRSRARVITVPRITGKGGRKAEILLSILQLHGPLHEKEINDIWIGLERGSQYVPHPSRLPRLCRLHAVQQDDGRWAAP
jgi:hypothetical protein